MTGIARILSYLPRRKIEEIEKVSRLIVDTGKAEIVVLFGSYARGKYKEKQGATQGKTVADPVVPRFTASREF
jgi:hypothetical protein